jgi:uncharacterized protein YcsI (UPF0317 family)
MALKDTLPVSGKQVRALAAAGHLATPTAGLARGYVQANLVIVPKDLAFEFLLFCQRNPRPCPLLEVTDPGSPEPKTVAPGSDLRTDLPRYIVYQKGLATDEPTDIKKWWRSDFVSFLLGCSFTFESALIKARIPVRHVEADCNVPMYRTNIACKPAGSLHGNMVVSMRPIPEAQVAETVKICEGFPKAHGAPLQIGSPEAIGIRDLAQPDFGDRVPIRPGEVPVFWACGVTPQAVVMEAKPPLIITHKPGHMFVTDLKDEDLARLEN